MKRKNSRPVVIALVMILLVVVLAGTTVGKYVTRNTVSGKITFSATLADSVTLLEHKAIRNADGSYSLSANETTQKNTYKLLPGVDIPKDPHITVVGKTSLEAYLFVEIVDTIDSGMVTYSVDAGNWKELTGVNGQNGGKVYVYSGGTDAAKILDANIGESLTVFILAPLVENKPETVRVSQYLLKMNQTTAAGNQADTDVLTFYAAMGQIAPNQDAAAVYKAIYGMTE